MASREGKAIMQILLTGISKIRNEQLKLQNSTILNFEFLTLNSRKRGFTLIELIIVIFIISLTTALIMPNLWPSGQRSLKSEAKRISNTLRYIYDEAAGKKESYILKIDLDTDSWGFESKIESRTFKMRNNVTFRDIVIPSLGEVSRGEVILKFSPMGPQEPITIHLKKDDKEYTINFNHISGRATIHEGYITE
jgi:type II secretion system protein H